MTYKNLTDLQEGERAKVLSLTNASSIKRRLQDLGLVEGTQVNCIQKSPQGDMVAYGIRGAIIALRAEDAVGVLVAS
ncbi:MAG: ferrous iron transport protein A [Oscillospiraceae bacterium]|nr:ferrous iron transport protein A [Oscillospiraceae bacterium]